MGKICLSCPLLGQLRFWVILKPTAGRLQSEPLAQALLIGKGHTASVDIVNDILFILKKPISQRCSYESKKHFVFFLCVWDPKHALRADPTLHVWGPQRALQRGPYPPCVGTPPSMCGDLSVHFSADPTLHASPPLTEPSCSPFSFSHIASAGFLLSTRNSYSLPPNASHLSLNFLRSPLHRASPESYFRRSAFFARVFYLVSVFNGVIFLRTLSKRLTH